MKWLRRLWHTDASKSRLGDSTPSVVVQRLTKLRAGNDPEAPADVHKKPPAPQTPEAVPTRTPERVDAAPGLKAAAAPERGMSLEGPEDAHLSAFRKQLQAIQQAFLEETQSRLLGLTAPLSDRLSRATEDATARMRRTQEQIEASLRDTIQEHQKRVGEAANEALRRKGVPESPPERTAKGLEGFASELLVRSTGELRRQAEAARNALEEQLRVARESFLLEIRQRLSSLAEPVLRQHAETVRQNARDAIAEIAAEELQRQGISQKLTDQATQELEKSVQQLLNRATKELEEQTRALAEQLRTSRESLLAEAEKQFAGLLEPSLDELSRATAERYREQLTQWLDQQIQSAQAASDSVTRVAQEAVAQLERSREQIEASLRGTLEEHQRRVVEAASEELERQDLPVKVAGQAAQELEKQAEQLLGRFSKQIDQEARMLTERLGETSRSISEETQKRLGGPGHVPDEASERMFNGLLRESMQQIRNEHDDWVKKHFEPLRRQMIYLVAGNREEERAEEREIPAARNSLKPGLLAGLVFSVAVAAVGIAAAVYFGAFSAPPVMQLRASPPAEFMDNHPEWNVKRRATENELARAYWGAAVRGVQGKYKYGATLPEQPPPEFEIDPANLPDNPTERAHYWEKLREVWATPQAWQQAPSSSTEGIGELIHRIGWRVQGFLSALRNR